MEYEEQFTFKAEINELMNMIIHNFYSNKDIFLRELVSNASDAINKLKHEGLQNKEVLCDFYDFMIRIKADKETNQLVIVAVDEPFIYNNKIKNYELNVIKEEWLNEVCGDDLKENVDWINYTGKICVGF